MWIDMVGYLGAGIFLVGYAMDGMIRLRVLSLISGVVLFGYGMLISSVPIMIEEGLFIPVNAYGLYKMLRLVRQSKEAVEGHQTMEWLRPFSSKLNCEAGQTLFVKGDLANDMYCIESGKYNLVESGIELTQGMVVGEFGFLSPGNTRTQTLRCKEGGVLLRISYDSLRELYFQNPKFGFYFLRLVTERLFQNQATARAGNQ